MKTLTILICSLAIAATLQSQIIHVPAEYSTVQQGIDAANPGDTVLVDDGTYYEQISFLGKKPLMVASYFLMDGDTNHFNNTIIDGSQLTDMDNASVVVFKSGEDTTSVLCGFTIRGGRGTWDASSNNRCGGGIYISVSGAKIINNKITANTVDDTQPVNGQDVYGGGIGTKTEYGNYWIVIEHNTVCWNTAVTQYEASIGGGIHSSYNTRIAYNIIAENSSIATNTGYAHGGGFGHSTDIETAIILIIHNNKIQHNIAQAESSYFASGGGVFTSNSYLSLTFNEISENSIISLPIGPAAGGVQIVDPAGGTRSSNNISNNVFIENVGINGGAIGIWTNDSNPGQVSFGNNYFIDNEALNGGAIYDYQVPVILQNNVISGNHANQSGGAIFLQKGGSYPFDIAVLINNSIAYNTSDLSGGALYANKAMPLIFNSVFFNDSAVSGPEIYINHYLDTLDLAYCNIDKDLIYGNIYDGGGNINYDPQFLDNILLTLQNNSECIDAGAYDYLSHWSGLHLCPEKDILGVPRPQSGGIDIGAYEVLFSDVNETGVPSLQFAVRSYPNPFSNSTTLEYELEQSATVNLSIYNNLGQQVAVLVDGEQPKGRLQVRWEAEGLPAGIYYFRLTTDGCRLITGKLVLK